MIAYVEWLRVRNCLKWTAIVLVALFLIAAGIRVFAIGVGNDAMSWAVRQGHEPDSKVADSVLPDGTHRITIDNAREGAHITIDDLGPQGKVVTIIDRSTGSKAYDRVVDGNISVHTLPHGGGTETIVTVSGPMPFYHIVRVGLFVALVIATILGAPFARESDGHLELALTQPRSREAYALSVLATDAAGIAGAFVLSLALAIATQALFETPRYTFGAIDASSIAVALLGSIAWYAMLTAATSSMKRGYGAIQGFSWPVSAGIVGLAVMPVANPMLAMVQRVCQVLRLLDPLGFLHLGPVATGSIVAERASIPVPVEILALALLALVYGVLAVVQWRRIEA